jgi:pre-60S factor REI1
VTLLVKPAGKSPVLAPDLTCRKTFSTENAYRSHVQSRKHRERELVFANNPTSNPTDQSIEHSSQVVQSSSEVARSTTSASIHDNDEEESIVDDEDDEDDEDDDDEDEEEVDIEAKLAASRRRRHLPSDCLFCTTRLPTIDACLQHMSTYHSFFIPDREYLTDISGLLAYLGEKVVVGNICLYCPGGSREFSSVEAVRRHMIDKSHCKMAFETDDDRIEISDYYTYEGNDDAGDEWEDVDGDGDTDGGYLGGQSHVSRGSQSPQSLQLLIVQMPTLADDGLSLTLPSGRVLGHRALRVYYSQHLRPVSQVASSDDRQISKVALVKQRLADPSLALIPVAGGMGGYGRGLEMMKARNPGEAKWARAQARSFKDQDAKRQHQTKVGYKHNSMKRE